VGAGGQRDVVHLGHGEQLAAHRLPGPLRDVQVDVGGQRVAGPHRVDLRGVPGDHALTLKPGDPGVGAGPGDVHQLRQCPHRQPAVGAQRLDDLPVGVVHRRHMSKHGIDGKVTVGHMARLTGQLQQFVSDSASGLEILHMG
jgi:hypothetical protein